MVLDALREVAYREQMCVDEVAFVIGPADRATYLRTNGPDRPPARRRAQPSQLVPRQAASAPWLSTAIALALLQNGLAAVHERCNVGGRVTRAGRRLSGKR